jgi:hypothetical protein
LVPAALRRAAVADTHRRCGVIAVIQAITTVDHVMS